MRFSDRTKINIIFTILVLAMLGVVLCGAAHSETYTLRNDQPGGVPSTYIQGLGRSDCEAEASRRNKLTEKFSGGARAMQVQAYRRRTMCPPDMGNPDVAQSYMADHPEVGACLIVEPDGVITTVLLNQTNYVSTDAGAGLPQYRCSKD